MNVVILYHRKMRHMIIILIAAYPQNPSLPLATTNLQNAIAHPLLGTLGNVMSSLLISLRHLTVWHKAHLAKLPAYGFTPRLFKLISSFLLIDLSLSLLTVQHLHRSPSPQDSTLSPTIFLFFTNDLLQSMLSSVHVYADGSILHKSSVFTLLPSSLVCS